MVVEASQQPFARFHSRRLVVLGMGLIGGSLALALRAAGVVDEVIAWGRRADRVDAAVACGAADRGETDLAAALAGADMVVVAVPVGSMAGLFAAIAPHLTPQMVITDVGSTKGSVVTAAAQGFGRAIPGWVPAHPIAGTERSGVEAAFATLYQQRRVIITPLPESDPTAVARVTAMWQAAGASVESMSVSHHDAVLAATSHLPHLLAYTLVDALAQQAAEAELFRYAAGGFADFTRIASSDPLMWHDIALANRAALLQQLDHFTAELTQLRTDLAAADGSALLRRFERAKRERDRFCAQRQTVTPPSSETGRA